MKLNKSGYLLFMTCLCFFFGSVYPLGQLLLTCCIFQNRNSRLFFGSREFLWVDPSQTSVTTKVYIFRYSCKLRPQYYVFVYLVNIRFCDDSLFIVALVIFNTVVDLLNRLPNLEVCKGWRRWDMFQTKTQKVRAEHSANLEPAINPKIHFLEEMHVVTRRKLHVKYLAFFHYRWESKMCMHFQTSFCFAFLSCLLEWQHIYKLQRLNKTVLKLMTRVIPAWSDNVPKRFFLRQECLAFSLFKCPINAQCGGKSVTVSRPSFVFK